MHLKLLLWNFNFNQDEEKILKASREIKQMTKATESDHDQIFHWLYCIPENVSYAFNFIV